MKKTVFVFFLALSAYCLLSINSCMEKISPAVYPARGKASWYVARAVSAGKDFEGGQFTCALRRKDYGKVYKVCNLANGNCVDVVHNDWGPARALYKRGRIIDLNKAAFGRLADPDEGVIEVSITEAEKTAE